MRRCGFSGAGAPTITFKSRTWGTVYVELSKYRTGNLAVLLYTNEDGRYEPLATLSVNIPEALNMLESPEEFFVKTWSENEDIAKDAAKSGLFRNTGRFARTDFVVAPIWRLAPMLQNMIMRTN